VAARRALGLAAAAVVVLVWGASPAWAARTISVDPSTDLVDRQVVTVSGTGYQSNTQVGLAVCEADPLSLGDCDLDNIRIPTTDGSGAFETTFPVRRYIRTNDGTTDCAVAPGACVLGNGPPELGPDFAAAPLSFDPDVPGLPPLEVTVTSADRATIDRRSGVAYLVVEVRCNRPDAGVLVEGELVQSSARGTTRSSSSVQGPCRQAGNGVLLTFAPDGRRFSGGDATLEASVIGLTEDGDVVVQSFDTVVYVVRSK